MIEKKYNFKLMYQEDGVYLNVLPNEQDNMMTQSELMELLQNKEICDLEYSKIDEAISLGIGSMIIIAPPQQEKYLDDYIEVFASSDKMEAQIKLVKGDEEGNRLTLDEVILILKTQYKIVFGFDTEVMKLMVENRDYGDKQVVARGVAPVNGIDGKIVYHFETDFNKVGADVDGRIDFKELTLFANVDKGTILASKTEPIEGRDGMDIYGNILPAKKPKEAKFFYGKNVLLSQDGESLMSSIDGKVDLVGNKVVVSKVYIVDGNVDMSVGNIDFSGDVIVRGNVMSGFVIRAGGSVDVYGVVEGAQIYAEENITLMGSFLGNGRGMLNAGGSVNCKSVEHGVIKAVISIDADYVMHSNLYCDGEIRVCKEKSGIIGGNICSGELIVANNVGTVKGTVTNLKIGLLSDVFKRLGEIQALLEDNNIKLKKLLSLKDKMLNNSAVDLNAKVKVMNDIVTIQKESEKAEQEQQRIQGMIQNAKNGKVEIRGRGYNGVEICINDIIKRVEITVDFTTFMVKDGEIVEYPCM